MGGWVTVWVGLSGSVSVYGRVGVSVGGCGWPKCVNMHVRGHFEV